MTRTPTTVFYVLEDFYPARYVNNNIQHGGHVNNARATTKTHHASSSPRPPPLSPRTSRKSAHVPQASRAFWDIARACARTCLAPPRTARGSEPFLHFCWLHHLAQPLTPAGLLGYFCWLRLFIAVDGSDYIKRTRSVWQFARCLRRWRRNQYGASTLFQALVFFSSWLALDATSGRLQLCNRASHARRTEFLF